MNAQEKANAIARIEEIKVLVATATKEDKVTLNAELKELEAKLKADEEAKQLPAMPTSIDIETVSSAAIHAALSPYFTKGKVIAIVEDCQEAGSDRSGENNAFRIKLAIPSESQKDVFGVTKKTLQGYWINANAEMAIGQVVTIELKGFVVTINNKVYEGANGPEIVHPKAIVRIDTIFDMEKQRLINDRYQMIKQKINIQGTEMFQFMDTLMPEMLADGE